MFQYSIGITALNLSQFGIDTVSHNVANANTPGYHRRQALLQALPEYRMNGRFYGAGVGLQEFRQIRDRVIENSLTNITADAAAVQQQLATDRRIEGLLGMGAGSLEEMLTQFQAAVQKLSTSPGDPAQRGIVLDSAARMTAQFRQTGARLRDLRTETAQQIDGEVAALNAKLAELAGIHSRILTTPQSQASGELIDRRDRLINEVAGIIDVTRNETVQAGLGLAVGGNSLGISVLPQRVSVVRKDDGTISLRVGDTDAEIRPRGGRLAGLLESHNSVIPGFQNRLDTLARNFIARFDQAHATGIGVAGPFARLVSTRTVTSTTQPLASAGLDLPLQAGELSVTMTDPAGERRTYSFAYDPAADSLADLATRLAGIPGLNASVSNSLGTLNVQASSGWRFDFTGRLETVPDLASFTGTARPSLSGRWTGSANDTWRVEMSGSGEIGVTDGLKALVYNGAGDLIAELDVGSKYEPGKPLAVLGGVELSFGAGSVTAGDSFETRITGNADTGGMLAALGLNSFFSGTRATDMDVSQRLRDQPSLLATGMTGDRDDATGLLRLVRVFETPVAGPLDAAAALTAISVDSGSRVETGTALSAQLSGLQSRYEIDRDAHSGVDLNEELVNLSKFQKAFEASLRVLQAIDSMYDEATRMLR